MRPQFVTVKISATRVALPYTSTQQLAPVLEALHALSKFGTPLDYSVGIPDVDYVESDEVVDAAVLFGERIATLEEYQAWRDQKDQEDQNLVKVKELGTKEAEA